MMTQDSATHGLTAATSPRNLNPTAQPFRQNQIALSSPSNYNPAVTMFNQSPRGDKSPADAIFAGTESARQGLLSNGDMATGGASYLLPTGGTVAAAQSQLVHQLPGHNLHNSMPMALTVLPHGMLVSSSANSHQPVVSSVSSQHQAATAAAYALSGLDVGGHQQLQKQMRSSSHSSAHISNGETYELLHNGTLAIEEEASKTGAGGLDSVAGAGADKDYPEEILAPIRKQMQFYFSNENLPSDKFLNQHMDLDKFIPLELFLDFGRIKPICNSIDLLTKAVETISVLELSEDRKKVRVSQCRKTLTLRGFPQSTTEEDVRQFILEMGADAPTHIEFVMFKDNYSVWYVSFRDESAALNSFFQFHNQKAVYKGHSIGCCIKSSGTLAAAGYFPSMEDSSQRRMAYQNQVAAAVGNASVHAVQNTISQPQPQQPQPLIQPFNTMQLHSYLSGSPANIYYQQTPQGSFLPYMAGMIHSWPGPAAAMEPGLIMQNNGLQPQHIRTSMPRAHLMPTGSAPQHRFNRPQRARQNNPERSNDRPSIVALPGPPSASPHLGDNSVTAAVVSQEAYLPRRAAVQEDVTPAMMSQTQVVNHKFATPVASQHQVHAVSTPAASTAVLNPSGLEPMSVSHYQPPQHHQHHHQHSVMVQAAVPATTCAPPPPTPHITSNPPPNTQLLHHQHIQPPPPIPQQQQHHHQQPPPQTVHHHQQQQHYHQQSNHSVQHSNQLPPQPQHHQPSQPSHHQQHHSYQHPMMPHQHHHQYHNSQQHHHQYLPPQSHQHQQSPPGRGTDKRNRRKREDNNIRSQRLERSQSNRTHFSSQSLAAVDNFTMEANSFPPLPGTMSSLSNSEVSHESRMADIVRGISRNASLGNQNAQRASSSTPSPVATPPASLTSGVVTGQHHGMSQSSLVDIHSVDDEDVTSSSQDDVDTDVNTFETKIIRSELRCLSSMADTTVLPSQSRPQKVSTPVTSVAACQAARQADGRQNCLQTQVHNKAVHQPAYSLQQVSAGIGAAAAAAVSTSEAPKLSYAQILAHKNREAASNTGSEGLPSGVVPPNSNSGSSVEPTMANSCTSAGNIRQPAQSANAFREHGNYQGGQQYAHRGSQRGSSKDGLPRSDGPPPARQPSSGRRNSKENRINKFERRKPDVRQK
ncbi:hypothetical protein BsWGS_18393 [Bradybaena similaris]